MRSPDFAEFSVFFAGLATISHHSCCVKTCHSRPRDAVISSGTANLSILAGILKRMLDCFSFMSRPRSVHASLGKDIRMCRFGSIDVVLTQGPTPLQPS